MPSDSSVHELIDELADDYIGRRQAGEDPAVSEYCQRYPHLDQEIRDLFPTLAMLERVKHRQNASEGFDPPLDVIGEYNIVREIGRGGMGVVYEAEQQTLGRRVALKVLARRTWVDDNILARFHHEARATAKLHHTNIVPLFEVGEENNHFFYAMQLIEGQSLEKVIAEPGSLSGELGKHEGDAAWRDSSSDSNSTATPSTGSDSGSAVREPYRTIADIGLQLAEALGYAHARGIIHRDIKPSNLLLDDSGIAWVTDFGLAKTDGEDLTRDGDFVGTLRYMSPERFRGECDHRADVYGLGLTLYELLARRPAFESVDRLRLIDHINKTEPTPLHVIDSQVPRDLETIVAKAMEKEPSARYRSADALADDLRSFLQDQPIRARRHSLGEQLYRWVRRNKSLAAALSTIAASLAMVIGVLAVANIRETTLRRQAQIAQRTAEEHGDELQLRGEQLNKNLYFAEMNLAGQAASDRYGVPTVRSQLQKWIPNSSRSNVDLRGWEWYCLYALSHRERFATRRLDGWTWSVDYNPAGTEYVNCVADWGIQIRSAETGEVVRDKFLGATRFVEWSPDGRQIAVSGYNANVNVLDAQSLGVISQIGGDLPREVWNVAWSPDGTRLATCRRPKDGDENLVRIWDPATGELLTILQGQVGLERPAGTIHEVNWSPNGTRLATAGDDNVRIWDAATGKVLKLFPEGATTVCWSPDGASLVLARSDMEIKNATTGESIATLRDSFELSINRVRWRPGARQLACGDHDGTVTLWDIDSGKKLRTFYGHSKWIRDLQWRPDGSQIVSSGMDNTVRVWDIGAGDQTQVLPVVADHVEWNSDGDWLSAAGIWNHTAAVCDPVTGKIQVIDNNAKQVDSASISPDGGKIAYTGRDFVRIWDRNTGETQTLDESGWFKRAAWNHDGSRLVALNAMTPALMIWNTQSGEKTDLVAEEFLVAVQWSGDGKRLATGGVEGADGTGRRWQGPLATATETSGFRCSLEP